MESRALELFIFVACVSEALAKHMQRERFIQMANVFACEFIVSILNTAFAFTADAREHALSLLVYVY